jgi:glycosyltransferase involved in cell wall biosynthesis
MLSVVIPCHNGENYLEHAITSVLKQNCPTALELIVVDDGSTDSSIAIANEYPCKVFSIAHSGLSAALNYGLLMSHGDYVLFLDHDDVLLDDTIENFLPLSESHTNISIFRAKIMDFISKDIPIQDGEKIIPQKDPYWGSISGSTLFRRNVFDLLKFDESISTLSGIDFIERCQQNISIEIMKVDFISVMRRLHNMNMSRILPDVERKEQLLMLRRKFLKENHKLPGGGGRLKVEYRWAA